MINFTEENIIGIHMWIEIFRSGTNADSKGNERTWTHEDLDSIADQYNSQTEHEAPLVIGHPEANAPAFGWVEKLKRTGDILLMKPRQVHDSFKEMVNSGAFKKRSISIYPNLTLRHVGFLGAAAPAIKGLADFKFQEQEYDDYEFSDNVWEIRSIGKVFTSLREFIIEKFSLEDADKVIPAFAIDDLKATPFPAEDPVIPFNEANRRDEMDKDKTIQELTDQIAEFKSKETGFETQITTLKGEKEVLNTRVKELEQKDIDREYLEAKTGFEQFIEGLIEDECKITPAQKDQHVQTLITLSQIPEANFSEVDGKKVDPVQSHKDFLKSLSPKVAFGELNPGVGGGDVVTTEQILEYTEAQKKVGRTISPAQAVDELKTK